MGKSATEVRREIAQTRGELSETIEALDLRIDEVRDSVVDRVSPKRVWQRKTAQVRQRFDDLGASITGSKQAVVGSLDSAKASLTETSSRPERTGDLMGRTKTKIRGQAEELSQSAGETATSASEQAKAAPTALKQRTESNPMAAGLVALGAGFLAATLLPPSERERKAATKVQASLEPIKKQATDVGRSMAGELQQSAQGSVEQLKARAEEAVERVKQDAQSSSAQVKEQAQEATTQVKRKARSSARQVKETAKEGPAPGSSRPRVARSPRQAPRRSSSRSGTTPSS